MQRDNFLNPRIATLINLNFIPVLIDSELQSALDARLTEFMNRTLGYAGWPLQVFITPGGYSLAGTTFAPPDEFEPMLQELANEWNKDGKSLVARVAHGYCRATGKYLHAGRLCAVIDPAR